MTTTPRRRTVKVTFAKVGESKNCDIFQPTTKGYYGKVYVPKVDAKEVQLNGSFTVLIGA